MYVPNTARSKEPIAYHVKAPEAVSIEIGKFLVIRPVK